MPNVTLALVGYAFALFICCSCFSVLDIASAEETSLQGSVDRRGVIGKTAKIGAQDAGFAFFQVELMLGGGFKVENGGQEFDVATSVSYPNAGFNHLKSSNTPVTGCQKGWSVNVKKSMDGGTVLAEGPDYRIQRKVQFGALRIAVSDTFVNLNSNAKLGLLVRNELALKHDPEKVCIAGHKVSGSEDYYSNGNPSVYAAVGNSGIGLMCDDDVFRNQATLFYDSKTKSIGTRTEMLCLQPGGSYTLRWSIYPVLSTDYYDFINLVREEVGSNYKVEGAWTFFDPYKILSTPVEEITKKFNRLGIKYACSWGGWVDSKKDQKRIGFGTDILQAYWEEYRNTLKSAGMKIRSAVPKCKVLFYYDAQRDTSENAPTIYKDSKLTDAKGRQVYTDWGGRFSRTWSVVATAENSYGKAMYRVAEIYMDEMKGDGLYWDEMECIAYGRPLMTCDIPDGYSCLLDKETFTIVREVGLVPLLGESFRLGVIDLVKSRGGVILGNGPAVTNKVLLSNIQRMIEIQHNDVWNFEGNLQSPLGYAGSNTHFGNWVRAIDLGMLLVGTRYEYDYDISRYVFPFTPIEIHEGYLLGKERIVTTKAGSYGWTGENNLAVAHHFDARGAETTRKFSTELGSEARTKADIISGEVLVLEKLPIVVEPSYGILEIDSVVFGKERISFHTIRGGEAILRVGNSAKLSVNPGSKFEVRSGDHNEIVEASVDGQIALKMFMKDETMVSINPWEFR